MTYYCDNNRHLICVPYSVDNLHIMAKDLNINKCWFHNGKFPHYDIPKKMVDEIMNKCKVISSSELINIIKFFW